MQINTDVLEGFRNYLVTCWAKSRNFVPGWALLFRGVALEIEHTLNAHTAAQWGLADDTAVRRAAVSALAALDSLEERGRTGVIGWVRQYDAEYAVLRQLARVELECDEPRREE
jgi:hypothetical protein